ncbi:MAG TPA: radical SAM protein [Candidatus Bathyarchaeia archaeon]
MRRALLTVDGRSCPFGCSYCFADFSQYEPPTALATVESRPDLLRNIDIIYPACDVDLFARPDALLILERVAALKRSISISTKAALNYDTVQALALLAGRMHTSGLTLKIGVSFSTKHRVREIEPRTPSYETRLKALAGLAQQGIARAAVLRPLLVDIPDWEYEEILDDIASYTRYVLIGAEWLDATETLQRKYGDAAVPIGVSMKPVNWAKDKPLWPVRESPDRVSNIREFAHCRGLDVSESDLELMGKVIEATGRASPASVNR